MVVSFCSTVTVSHDGSNLQFVCCTAPPAPKGQQGRGAETRVGWGALPWLVWGSPSLSRSADGSTVDGWVFSRWGGIHCYIHAIYESMQDFVQRKLFESLQIYFYGQ